MKLTAVLTVSALVSACAAFGADAKVEKQEKAERPSIPAGKIEARSVTTKATTTDGSFSVFDAWNSFTVPAGGLFKLSSKNDYTGADHVSIAIECPTGNSVQNISIAVWWGNSNATYLTLTDLISGSNFILSNMGGGTVPVYGQQIFLEVVNTGSTPISCDQVTTYAVVH